MRQPSRHRSPRRSPRGGNQHPPARAARRTASRGAGRGASRAKPHRAAVLLCAATALLALFAWQALAPGEKASDPRASIVYHWESLFQEDDRPVYRLEGKTVSRIGIDVSEHQGAIDWEAVARDDVGFAFVRIGNRGWETGSIDADEYGLANIDRANQAGIDVGVYFFSQAVTEQEAVEEAQFVVEQIDGRKLDLPIVYDHEPVFASEGRPRANSLSPEQLTANARAFCQHIERAGYDTMIYGNAGDLQRYDLDQLPYPLWYAEYDVFPPSADRGFSFWQYRNDGSVDGIETPVDMNVQLRAEKDPGRTKP